MWLKAASKATTAKQEQKLERKRKREREKEGEEKAFNTSLIDAE